MSCTRSLEAAYAGRRVKRESGVNPGQYLLLCISTPSGVWLVAFFATGESWEGATSGISQKTYLGVLKGLYLQDTGTNQKLFFFIVFINWA